MDDPRLFFGVPSHLNKGKRSRGLSARRNHSSSRLVWVLLLAERAPARNGPCVCLVWWPSLRQSGIRRQHHRPDVLLVG